MTASTSRNVPPFPIAIGDFMQLAMKAYWDANAACMPPPGTQHRGRHATSDEFIDSVILFVTQRLHALPEYKGGAK